MMGEVFTVTLAVIFFNLHVYVAIKHHDSCKNISIKIAVKCPTEQLLNRKTPKKQLRPIIMRHCSGLLMEGGNDMKRLTTIHLQKTQIQRSQETPSADSSRNHQACRTSAGFYLFTGVKPSVGILKINPANIPTMCSELPLEGAGAA
jgi:hypothetical protein